MIDFADDGYQVRAYNPFDRLIYLDCNDTIQPGAAISWHTPDAGKTWIFDLRQDLIDENGIALDATALAQHFLKSRNNAFKVSSEALDTYRLAIAFDQPSLKLPPVLLLPRFAIPVANTAGVITVASKPGDDIRDRMDSDAGAVITADPKVIEYAALRPEWTSMPLGWDKTYALVIAGKNNKPATLPEAVVHDLYQSVAGPDVRQRGSKVFWASSSDCDSVNVYQVFEDFRPEQLKQADAHYNAATYLLKYDAQDVRARSLAERLVALSSGAIDIPGADSMRMLMQIGDEERRWIAHVSGRSVRPGLKAVHAVIGGFSHQTLSRCNDTQMLYADMAPLLQLKPDQKLLFLPIVDMRPRILIRDKRLQVVQDARNVVLLSIPGQKTEEE
ncbi:MAG: hypothetical protein AAF564_20270 [Bacteroidota bacterium]